MIRWITERLGTAPRDQADDAQAYAVLDVRELVDREGNSVEAVRGKIAEGRRLLATGKPVVVCCDFGMSRSNSIAAALLAGVDGLAFNDAVRRVLAATGESAIRIEVLDAVRRALDEPAPAVEPAAILITGGRGFIGSAVRGLLENRARVLAPTHAEIDLLRGAAPLDLFCREHAVQTLIHLAHPRVYTSSAAMGEQIVMLKNVLDVCAQRRIHLVMVSGWEVFSGYATELVADESTPPNPAGTYGQAKWLGENLMELMRRREGLAVTLLRSGPVYGPGSARPRFIWNFLRQAAEGTPIITHRYRNGPAALDLMHVRDMAAAIAAAALARPGGTIHLGHRRLVRPADVARWFIERLGSRSTLTEAPIDRDVANVMMDNARARAALGWQPVVGLDEGLTEMLEAHVSHKVPVL
jgi:UDP-glucuronate decarboxylase